MTYTAVVIGGGPGGYVAAIRLAQLGAKVALVEQELLGGTCLNKGCIPTKALIATVDKLKAIAEAADFGILVDQPKVNFNQVQVRKKAVVEKLAGGVKFLLEKHKVEYVPGRATIKTPYLVEVNEGDRLRQLSCQNIIVATGSSPALIDTLGYNGRTVLTSDEALQLDQIPKSILVIGAGVIGCEFAHIFGSLGAQITMVEAQPSILPTLDRDIARRLQTFFKRQKYSMKTNATIEKIEDLGDSIRATLAGGDVINAEKALISVGRTLNTQNLGLREAGVKLGNKGQILVNDMMQTNIANIYAVGDVVMRYQLAHVASTQGIVAAYNIMGESAVMDYSAVPGCVFTNPEIAAVGLTEQQAKAQGYKVKTGKFNFMANGKALSMGEGDGFVKIITDQATDVILGVHIIGPHASDLIATATLAVKEKLTARALSSTIFAHPTLAETMMEAAENVHGLSIHG